MVFLVFLIVVITIVGIVSYYYFKAVVNEILEKLVILDKIFEQRYNDLSKAISQFQKFMPEQKDLIIDVQRAKADAAKVSKPKNTDELAQKIVNENSLTLSLNYLIDKCDFQNLHPDLKICIDKQLNYIKQIETASKDYNKSITTYKTLKEMFPFKMYSKNMGINLDLDIIRTE